MARSFNGTSDVIKTGFSGGWSGDFSCSIWLLPTSTGGIAQQDGINDGTSRLWAFLGGGSGAAITFYTLNAGVSSVATAALTNGLWYNIVGTYHFVTNGTSVQTIYRNGSQDQQISNAAGPIGGSNTVFTIGARGAVTTDEFSTQSTADVALWSAQLTAAEVAALAKGARPYNIRRGSLVGYWPLDGLQSPEPDLSGNKFNGTLTGTALAFNPPLMMFTPRRLQTPPPPPPLFYTIRKQVRLNILQTGP